MLRRCKVPASGTPLTLASASPRRRRLLGLLDIPFVVAPVDVDEAPGPGESGGRLARRLAREKALAGAHAEPGRLVLAADTVVDVDGRPLGKPADEDEARATLRALRGRSHRVITGLALAIGGRLSWHGAAETEVRMRRYGDEEIERYVATGRPLDKAGGYAVQDPDFRPAEGLRGCYPNVVGLPLCEALRGLRAAGLRPAGPAEEALTPPCALCERSRALDGDNAT
jgi:septum formation protein